MNKYIKEKEILSLLNYPVLYSGIYHKPSNELINLQSLFREIDFQPRRITASKRSVKVLGGLFEFTTNSVIFEE